MLNAVYLLFIIPKLPLWCFPAGLVKQKALRCRFIVCGQVELLHGFILPQQCFPFLVSWVSVICAGESLLEAP